MTGRLRGDQARAAHPNFGRSSWEDSDNWAGNIAIGSGYTNVDANWYVPCVTSPPSSAWSSMWVGLGGDGSDGGGNLVQAGTESDLTSTGGTFYAAWFEDWPHDPVENRLTNFPVACGDYMYAEVAQYSTSEQYFIDDYTSNSYAAPSESGYTSNGSTAEWIVERPSLNISYTTLADFRATTFHNTNTTHNYAVMCRDGWWTCGPGSTQLAHPRAISGNGLSFVVYHDAS